MADIIDKDYSRKVPADFQRSSVKWYIPHHGVYHPHKPGKESVVFDCSAKYTGMSFNDQLLKGPYLTNSLFGVLSRFRQERIARMAAIEAMFYQVRVIDAESTYLHFLWCLEEYKMIVHLFDAASSPACSNFALRRTAEDNIEHFSKEIFSNVRKNPFVDDCLKSLPTKGEASQLHAICEPSI